MRRPKTKNKILRLVTMCVAAGGIFGCGTTPPTPAVGTTPPATRAKSNIDKPATPVTDTAALPPTLSERPVTIELEGDYLGTSINDTTAAEPTIDAEVEDSGDYADLWARVRAGFALPKLESPLIQRHERWFVENVQFREAMFARAKMYLYYIVEEVEKRGMPMEIALLPAIESAYKPYAYSRARASGLWQFIPSTGKHYGLKSNWWYDGRRDVIAATRAALDYLQKLHGDFDGDWHLALAAYNAGEGRIMRAIQYNRRKGRPTSFEHLTQLKPETKHYVPKLFAMVNLVADPAKHGIALADIPNEPYFTTVQTDSQIDLGVVARLTGMEVESLHHINAGYMRWATHPEGPHQLLVPVDKKEALLAALDSLPEKDRVQWRHHEVRKGETIYSIARRYGLHPDTLKSVNNLKRGVQVGQSLLLPISAHAPAAVVEASSTTRVRTAGRANQLVIHRVRPGDTLWSLARRYNVLVRQIAEWNRMRPNDALVTGRKIKIWTHGRPSA